MCTYDSVCQYQMKYIKAMKWKGKLNCSEITLFQNHTVPKTTLFDNHTVPKMTLFQNQTVPKITLFQNPKKDNANGEAN